MVVMAAVPDVFVAVSMVPNVFAVAVLRGGFIPRVMLLGYCRCSRMYAHREKQCLKQHPSFLSLHTSIDWQGKSTSHHHSSRTAAADMMPNVTCVRSVSCHCFFFITISSFNLPAKSWNTAYVCCRKSNLHCVALCFS